jgi:hypothetical protein
LLPCLVFDVVATVITPMSVSPAPIKTENHSVMRMMKPAFGADGTGITPMMYEDCTRR